jgi:hypothetical protein
VSKLASEKGLKIFSVSDENAGGKWKPQLIIHGDQKSNSIGWTRELLQIVFAKFVPDLQGMVNTSYSTTYR